MPICITENDVVSARWRQAKGAMSESKADLVIPYLDAARMQRSSENGQGRMESNSLDAVGFAYKREARRSVTSFGLGQALFNRGAPRFEREACVCVITDFQTW